MRIITLPTSFSPAIARSLGELYLLLSPDFDGIPENLGESMNKEAIATEQRKGEFGLVNYLPLSYYLAINEHEMVTGYGLIQIKISTTGQPPTSCYSHIFVHPEYRNQGIASLILKKMLDSFHHSQLSSIFFFAEDEIGKNFLIHRGGTITESSLTYELSLDLSTQLPARDNVVTIVENPDESQLTEFIQVYNTAKLDEPRGDEGRYDPMTAKDFLHYSEKYAHMLLVGMIFADNRLVGVTDMIQTGVKGILSQRFTGVLPEYRGRGLATRLKQGVLSWLQENKPHLLPVIIRTSSLTENTGMHTVNTRLGFEVTGQEMTVEFFNER